MSRHFFYRFNRASRAAAGIIVIAGIAILGVYLHNASHAATPYASTEAEAGSLTSPAAIQNDVTASGGKYVQFGTQAASPNIMVLWMENLSTDDVISQVPYQTQLSQQYEFLPNAYGLGHYSEDNYTGFISGNFYDSDTGDPDPQGDMHSDPTLANQLNSAGISWAAYMGGMQSNCESSDDGSYGVRHDPWAYFSTITACASHVFPASQMISDLNSTDPPTFVQYSPSLTQDGGGDQGCDATCGDNFLQSEIPKIMATNWYKAGGTIILSYDEGSGDGQGEYLHQNPGNNIPMTIISTATQGKPNNTSYINWWGVLAGVEKAYGLSCLGNACDTSSNGLLTL